MNEPHTPGRSVEEFVREMKIPLRDYFAGQTLSGFGAELHDIVRGVITMRATGSIHSYAEATAAVIAESAYLLADAMLRARNA